jgi:hypothetical protein
MSTTRFLLRKQSRQQLITTFGSDDDFSLTASVFLDSRVGRQEILRNLEKVFQSYGFTNFTRISGAPGSFFFSIHVTFGTKDRALARKSKKELTEDLKGKELPEDPARRDSISKLKKSLWQRAKKRMTTIIVSGALFVGSMAGEVFKDEIKSGIEKWLENNEQKIVQEIDGVVAAELPPAVAKKFHEAVKQYIDKSPEKVSLEPPPEE